MKTYVITVIALLVSFLIQAQNVAIKPTIEPQFFGADDEITISYDVTGTSASAWNDAWLWLWIPNLNSFDAPSNINPADSNTDLTDDAKLTKSTVNGRQIFSITLKLTDFVGKSKEEIKTVGMLMKGNDWGDGQTTDFETNVSDDFQMLLVSPESSFDFYSSAESIDISIITSEPSDIKIYLDGNVLAEASGVSEMTQAHTIITDGAVHNIKAIASTTTEKDSVFYAYTIEPTPIQAPVPEGLRNGINYHADSISATLVLLAPNKENVFVIGDFNDWSINSDYLMQIDGERFWLKLDNLEKGKEYRFQYLVDGDIRIADPYSEKISSSFDDSEIIQNNRYPNLLSYPSDQTSEAASYLQTSRPQFDWQITDFQKPANEDLVIYELLVRDFDDKRTYNAVTERLDYLESLGINAIELMPVMEFEGNLSWGYNPAFMLAADKYYGTENDLKNLIDEAHKRGIAIILDIALNHAFGRNSLVRLDNEGLYGEPTSNNVWLNTKAKHDFNVGYDFNHESQYTKDYVDRVTEYWINEYKIDGYRFDLSKGFTQKNTLGNTGAWGNYDASRVALLKRMADHIWSIDPSSYVILEHFADNVEEKQLANYGMMLWGNLNHEYISAAKGNSSRLNPLYYQDRDFNDPHVIGYMESHDEERVMWELADKDYVLTRALTRAKLNAAFFFLIPGPKMLWQFGELGYDIELNDDRLGIKPTKWEYLDDPNRKKVFDVYSSLIRLKTKTDYLDDQYFSWDGNRFLKWINYDGPNFKLAAYGNFSNELSQENAHFPADGTWYEYFTGEEIVISDHANFEVVIQPGEFHVYTTEPVENNLDESPLSVISNLNAEFQLGIKLFPNPANANVTISSEKVITELKIFDFSGSELKSYTNNHSNEMNIDISDLDVGMYFLKGYSNGIRFTKKIIKQN